MAGITEAITQAKLNRNGAVIGYLPIGFPDLDTSVLAAISLFESGFDIIELGIPYSDPVMDGPIIQEATQQALDNGFKLKDVFTAVARIREKTSKPILLMSYWNPILQYGPTAFAEDLLAAGGNGIITPDLIPDEAQLWLEAANKTGLDKIFLAALTSTDERILALQNAGSGFVYAVSTMGITGTRQDMDSAAQTLVARIKAMGQLPACVGIGISSAEHVREVLSYADGAIIGSALVKALKAGGIPQLKTLAESFTQAAL